MGKASSGKNTPLLLAIVLVLAILFAVYYYLVMPKKDEVSAAESTVNSLQSEITTLQEQIALVDAQDTDTTIDVFALRKKVPADRAVADLLRNIEQLDYVAGTRIQTIGFNNYDSLVSSSGLQDPNYVAPVEGTDGSTDGGASGTETSQGTENTDASSSAGEQTTDPSQVATPVSTITPEQLPAELKMLTLSVSVEAPDYAALLKFIKEVEKLERVVRVDTISYTLAGEESDYDPKVSKIVSASIQVTTFYYEGAE